RTREIGVLRAVGVRRRQVRMMVAIEAVTLSLVALVLSVPLGWVLSQLLLRGATRATAGVFAYAFPWTTVPLLGGLATLMGVLAAVAPARHASRVDPVAALRFE